MRSAFVSRTFYALENREFRVLWWGTVLFHLGQQMQVLARGYLAFELTGRNSALGAVLLAYGIPQLLFAAWGGAAADRFAKRNILWIAESGLIASSAWLALMVGLDLVGYWMLIVVSASTVWRSPSSSLRGRRTWPALSTGTRWVTPLSSRRSRRRGHA